MDYQKTTEYSIDKNSESYEKSYVCDAAIGLQKVDALENSDYLYDLAKKHIDGEISFTDAKKLIHSYYESKRDISDKTEEADKVAVRIAEILSEQSFSFSSIEYISIHYRLFEGIYAFAGKIRTCNISKKEWVLDGQSVIYGDAYNLLGTLEYDLQQEKNFHIKVYPLSKSLRTVKTIIKKLIDSDKLTRVGSKKTGKWIVK